MLLFITDKLFSKVRIRTKLYSAPLKILYDLHEKAKASSYLDASTPECILV
jgi:hypothetical protein